MAPPGNPNNQPTGAPFDVHKFFNPSPPPPSTNPNTPQNPNNPSASYPPPSGPYSYPPQTSSPIYHHQFHIPPPYAPQPEHISPANLHHQRSVPYSTPPLQPHNPNHGARLMALLSSPSPSSPEIPPQQLAMQLPPPQNPNLNNILPSIPLLSAPMRMPSSKLPKGRHLVGDHVLYDVDVRLAGEVQPQLEVTPITKYTSDPVLVLGRQIAVNKSYICYGLKQGAIRVLNINTALRSLFKGLAQRVSDMAFFAEDVHLLAGASTDGRVFIWKITEGTDVEEKPQITGNIVVAIYISGEGKSVHPRVCWHCHKQEVLVVGIGNRILKIDTTKVGKGEVYSAEEPLECPVEKLIDGVQFVGNHDGEVTDLSMCQWMTTRLVSASVDGTVLGLFGLTCQDSFRPDYNMSVRHGYGRITQRIKIWDDRKSLPIAILKPHDGLPVNSATFLTAPQRPDHIILITGGPLNREIKVWASESEEGWLLPSDSDSWHCTQTLELRTSAEPRGEEVFFNQVLALSQAGLLLLANAKKNAIYVIHLDYGPNPEATHMDYIAEFTVTMPILSFTGTSDLLPHGEQIVQVYCVQTQAIQQYALDLLQCLPPPMENVVDRSDSSVSRDVGSAEGFAGLESVVGKSIEMSNTGSTPQPYETSSTSAPGLKHPLRSPSTEASTFASPSSDIKPISSAISNDTDIACAASPSIPLSPRLSRKPSDFISPSNSQVNDYGADKKIIEYSVDRQIDSSHGTLSDIPSLDDDSRNDENRAVKDDSSAFNRPLKFMPPTHLVTPSEILAKTSSESNLVTEHKSDEESEIQDVVVNSDTQNKELEVKVVGESGFNQNADIDSQAELHSFPSEQGEKSFCSQASDLGIEMASNALPKEGGYNVDESKQVDGVSESKSVVKPSRVPEKSHGSRNDITGQIVDSVIPPTVESPAQSFKGKKHKGKNPQESGPTSSSPSVFNSTDFSNEPGVSSSFPNAEAVFSQIQTMQEMLIQLTTMHKEMQKQITANVTAPVTKEGRRLEVSLGKMTEKAVKANNDALLARFLEENAKQDKLSRERTQQLTQQMTGLITNFLNKDFPGIMDKTVKKELAAVSQVVARTVSPVIEKSISTAITEAFQRGVGDKAVNLLDKSVSSKLETTVSRQIQAQFQTSVKQALQESLKSSMETSVVPAFESSCKTMFEHVDATFQKGMVEHTTAAQQQFESMHSPLAITLRDTINSASSVTQTLSSELAEGQRKLVALAVAGANSKAVNPLVAQISNGPLSGFHEKIEAPLDPTKELSRLVYEHKYEEAFTTALQRSDVSIVSWLCSQVDLQGILSMNPLPLSQGVLLSLLQQLACDISKETPRKLAWMTDVVTAIKPTDQMIAMHVRPIFEQVYQILNHQLSLPTNTVAEISSMRVVLVIINSTLRSM